MSFRSWLFKWFPSNKKRVPYRRGRHTESTMRLLVEPLEDRVTPSGLQPGPTIFQPQVAPGTPVNTEQQTVMAQPLLQFQDTDAGALSHLTATITWGDGTQTVVTSASAQTATIVSAGGNAYQVNSLAIQAHVYEEAAAGTHFSVSVSDDGFAPPAGTIRASTALNNGNGVADPGVTTLVGNNGLNLDEGTTAIIDGSVLTASADGGDPAAELVYTLTALPAHGQLYNTNVSAITPLALNGTFTQDDLNNGFIAYTHDGSDNFSDGFNFSVQDGGGAAVTGTFAITVNDGPQITTSSGGLTLAEGTTAVIDSTALSATADASDPPSEILFTLLSVPAHGRLYNTNVSPTTPLAVHDTFTQQDINSGFIAYAHDGSENFTDSFDFSAQDVGGAVGIDTFNITVTEAAASVAVNKGLTLGEGTTATVSNTLLSTNPGDASSEIVYTLTGAPVHGSLYNTNVSATIPLAVNGTFTQQDINGGFIAYTHDGSEQLSDSFTFSVQDDSGAPVTGTFSITATEAAATLTNNGLTVGEGAAATITSGRLTARADAVDPASELVYTLTATPAHGNLYNTNVSSTNPLAVNSAFTQQDINNGFITYSNTIGSGPDGTDSFAFSVRDGSGAAATGTFQITVTEAAAVLTANSGLTLGEGTSATIQNTALNASGDAGDPAGEFVYKLTAAPLHGGLYNTNVSATTPLANNGTFTQDDINHGFIVYTNTGGSSGPDNSDSFGFSVQDDSGAAATGTFQIALTEAATTVTVNNGLALGEGTTAIINNTLLSAGADAGDPAGELVYTLTAGPLHGSLYNTSVSATTPLAVNSTFTQADLNNGSIAYTHDGSDQLSDSFAFSVQDDNGVAAVGTFTISVTDAAATVTVNNGLTLGEGTTATISNTLLSAGADASDPASEIVYTLTAAPAHGGLYNTNVSAAVPLAVNAAFTQDDINKGLIAYTHDGSDQFSDSFGFSVQDAGSAAASGTFSITATEAAASVTVNNGLTLSEGATAAIQGGLLRAGSDASDPAGELVYTLTATPVHGSLYNAQVSATTPLAVNNTFTQDDINNGFITYSNTAGGTPDGTDGFAFSVRDDSGTPAAGTFQITVTETAATITANNGLTIPEGATGTIAGTLLSASTDAGDPAGELVYTLTAAPTHGSLYNTNVSATTPLAVNGTFTQDDLNKGFIVYASNAGNSALDDTDSFTFSVRDDSGAAATGAFHITVTEAAASVVNNNTLSLAEGTSGTIGNTLLLTSTDTGDPASEIVYTLTADPAHGSLLLNGATTLSAAGPNSTFTQDDINHNRLTYANDATRGDGNDGFGFSVRDDSGPAATGTFQMGVTEAAAVVTTNHTLAIGAGATGGIGSTLLASSTDPAEPASEVVYTVTADPAKGQLFLNGTTVLSAAGPSSTFTQDDINHNRLTYVNGGSAGNDTFGFSVKDDSGPPATGTFTISVAPGAAGKLGFSGVPNPGLADVPLSFQVHVEDQFGNTVTSNSSQMKVIVSGPSGFASMTLSAPAVNGVAGFGNLNLHTLGAYTLSASDGTLTPAAAPFTLAFADSFNQANGTALNGTLWTLQRGTYVVQNQSAVAASPISFAASRATARDVAVSATFALGTATKVGSGGGLVARSTGAGDGNFYFGGLVQTRNGLQPVIKIHLRGVWTTLATGQTIKATGGTLEFEVVGSSLKLFFNNALVAFTYNSKLTSGAVGMRAGAGMSFSSFAAVSVTVGSTSLPFTDNFAQPSDGSQLSRLWTGQLGDFTIQNQASVGVASTNMATVNGVKQANVTVQADLSTAANGDAGGLVARYSGTGEGNFYLALLIRKGNSLIPSIRLHRNGVWATLVTRPAIAATGGTVQFQVSGHSLKLFVNGHLVASATNSALATGTVGIRASRGVSWTSFSAS
jgi:hypothetical protein